MINRWISGILGLVVAVVPFLSLTETTSTWTLVIVGVAIAVNSFLGMLGEPTESSTYGTRSHT